MTSGDDVLSDNDGEVSKVTRRLGIHVGEGDEVKKKKKGRRGNNAERQKNRIQNELR